MFTQWLNYFLMEELNLRVATVHDIPMLKVLEQEIILAERPFEPLAKPDPIYYYSLDSMLSDDETMVCVACAGDTIVASGYGRISPAKPYLKHRFFTYVGFIYVAPCYRGKGVVEAILMFIEEWSLSQGINVLHLDVFADNHRAIRAYEKFGFASHLLNMRKVIKS